MKEYFRRNEPRYKVWRTILQLCISWIVADGGGNLIEILTHIPMPEWVRPLVFSVLMAVLAGVMPYIGGEDDEPMDKPELPRDYWEGGDE